MIASLLERLTGRGPTQSDSFPPYRLLQRDYLKEAQAKHRRLERLYHVGHRQAWDGKEILAELVKKHGGVHIDASKKKAIARVFSVILWGELAAWNVAADIAEALEDTEAKMAASGQVFDEARHFYTLRDYLLLLDVEIPPLDAYTRVILIELLEATNIHAKLIGMQLLVENVAVQLFQEVALSGVEPVLTDLMPYFERDEARHVGLGVLYLPAMLEKIGPIEAAQLQLFQLKVSTFIVWASILLRDDFEKLGVDLHRAFDRGFKNQLEVLESLGRFADKTRGIYNPGGRLKALHDQTIRFFFPRRDGPRPAWLQAAHGVIQRVALSGERVMEWAA